MDVELHSVGSPAASLPKSLQRILGGIAGSATMGEDSGRDSCHNSDITQLVEI
jgi:hypothetical protein